MNGCGEFAPSPRIDVFYGEGSSAFGNLFGGGDDGNEMALDIHPDGFTSVRKLSPNLALNCHEWGESFF